MWYSIPHLWVKATTYVVYYTTNVVYYTTNVNSPEIPILFDESTTSPQLICPTTGRVKPPDRRPPSQLFLKENIPGLNDQEEENEDKDEDENKNEN